MVNGSWDRRSVYYSHYYFHWKNNGETAVTALKSPSTCSIEKVSGKEL